MFFRTPQNVLKATPNIGKLSLLLKALQIVMAFLKRNGTERGHGSVVESLFGI